MKSTLQRLIDSKPLPSPPWSCTEPLASLNYTVALEFLACSIAKMTSANGIEVVSTQNSENWTRDLRSGRLTQARRRQVLRAYLHECERDKKAYDDSSNVLNRAGVPPTFGGLNSSEMAAVKRWIHVFETSQPASAINRYFSHPLSKLENSSHPVHRELKKCFNSSSTFPLLGSRSWIAAVRHWAGNTTAGLGGVRESCQDPWLEQVHAELAVKEVGQHVVPYMLWISELERLHCPAERIYTRTERNLPKSARSVEHKADTMIEKRPPLPDEIQAVLTAFASLSKGPRRTRFAAEKSERSVVQFFPRANSNEHRTYWFDDAKLCFRVPHDLSPAPAWIEAYVVDGEGFQLDVELSEADDVYAIEPDPNELAPTMFTESGVKWVGMTPLSGEANQAFVILLDRVS